MLFHPTYCVVFNALKVDKNENVINVSQYVKPSPVDQFTTSYLIRLVQ